MSITVALDDLAAEIERRGPGYLLTSGGGRPHVMHQRFTVEASGEHGAPVLITDVGRTASANIAIEADVTLLWPPGEPGGYSLIVDGAAEVSDGRVRVTAVGAVLHRPA